MAHELCDTSFFDEDITEYEELIAMHQAFVSELESLDEISFYNPLSDSVVRPFLNSATRMRIMEYESRQDALKREREIEISKAESTIAAINSRIRNLKLLKSRYRAFFEHKLLPAIEGERASRKRIIANLANIKLMLAENSDESESFFTDFGLSEELDEEFGSICKQYGRVSYRNNLEKVL